MADQVAENNNKISLAVSWAAACGGCDVAILDLEDKVLDLAAMVDFVFWPVAMDFKRDQLRALDDGSVDVGLFNGAVRTSEQEEDALLMRKKCKVLAAFGSCACFGGIPGLGNCTSRQELMDVAYRTTPSTDNPDDLLPQTATEVNGATLTLPEFSPSVRALHQVVNVDLFVPGCPPVEERLVDLVNLVAALRDGQAPPPAGTTLASDRGLCWECPRGKTRGRSGAPQRFVRPDMATPDPDRCLLDQGFVCMGIATRGGCGAKCVQANMPCRGCYGPLPHQLDPAAELVSALATLPGPRGNWSTPSHEIVNPARSVADPLGTFYRFTYPVSAGRGTARDSKE